MSDAVDQKLSDELGFDVAFVEQQAHFQLDLLRMKRGEDGQLGYVLMDRQDHPDVAVVFSSVEIAKEALEEHPLIDSLAEEDCLDAQVPARITIKDLASREIILPD